MRQPIRTRFIAASVVGALWLLSGLAHVAFSSNVYATRALRLLVPTPTNALFWSWSPQWSSVTLLLGSLSTAAVCFLLLTAMARRQHNGPSFTSAWFSVIVAGAVTGLVIDGIVVLSSVHVLGWRAVAMTSVEYAIVGAYWGLVQGWIPALIARRARDEDAVASVPSQYLGWSAGITVVVIATFFAAGTIGSDVTQRAIAEEQTVSDGSGQQLGAAPDPTAPERPVPTVAPSAADRGASWCTSDQAMLLMGAKDAATGHRVLSIRVMNFSDAPCVVDGYPDVAFADQNGNALDVAVERGSSFMATDAGAGPIELPASGYAIAFIGWDANATDGALVASSLHAAQVAGDPRGSWPVALDIVDGSSVEITAWQRDDRGPTADSEG